METRTISFLLLTIILMVMGCAPKPKFVKPRVGETISIAPIAVNIHAQHEFVPTLALKVNIMWGGKALTSEKGETVLNFYDQERKLIYRKNWSDFEESYRTTDCSESKVGTMDGYLMGVALICDGSLDINKISFIEGINAKGDRRQATSWSTYMVSEEVLGVSIGLY